MRGTETVGILGGVVVEPVDVRGVAPGGVVVGHLQGAVAQKLIWLQCGENLGGSRGRKFGAIAVEQAREQQELIGRQRVTQRLHAQRSADRA
ncbi:hypothetical protein ACWDBO_54385 [Streptomyces mirabilis]|uniref:hypothetical protein n=1 Tax=Streptomyces TaxID=1883 RepID=UPI00332CC37B